MHSNTSAPGTDGSIIHQANIAPLGSARRQTNQLIRFTYGPRVVVYFFVVCTLAAAPHVSAGMYLLMAVALIMPHMIFLVSRRLINSADGARYVMLVDAALVGALIVALQFDVLATLSFLVCLVFGTLLIAPPRILGLNLAVVMLVCSPFITEGQLTALSSTQDFYSAVLLVSFSAVVAFLCFRYTSVLVEGSRAMSQENLLLDRRNSRFQPYITHEVFRSIAADTDIATRREHLTVFFSDIEGFTFLMDNLSEDTVTTLLNDYLDEMAQIADHYGATLDKFIGDGVMVFFGDHPGSNRKRDAVSCINMAVAMRARLTEIAGHWEKYGSELHIRIGIHSGYCTVGNFGSSQRMDYTAVGSVVNQASRLEGCATRDEILISDSTFRLVRSEVACVEKPPVKVKGIRDSIRVYAVHGLRTRSSDEVVRLFS
jgi:adenylate cyclase